MKNNITVAMVIIILMLIMGITILFSTNISILNKNKELVSQISNKTNSSPISEEKAIEIYEKYRKEVLLDSQDLYNFIEIKQEKMKVENKYLLSSFPDEYIYRTTLGENFPIKEDTKEIDIYALYYKSEGNLDRMIGYVDMYTGEIIGNYQEGI